MVEFHFYLWIKPQMNCQKKCANARKKFFEWGSILKRSLVQFKRSFDLGMLFIFLTQNFNLKNEVLEKYDLPYADNLDEMPK